MLSKIKIAKKYILILLVIFTGIMYSHALFFADVSNDAGYYLSLAQQIISGNRLYVDILNDYAPFAFYYFAGVMALFGQSYLVQLFFQLLIIFIGAYFLFRCLQVINKQTTFNLILTSLYLISNYYYDAPYIYLEPFVNLFGVLSILFLLKWKKSNSLKILFIAGIFAALSFLSKQFGIIYWAFGGLYILSYILFKADSLLKRLTQAGLTFGLGLLIPFIFLGAYYLFIGVTFSNFIISRIMSGYPDESLARYLISVKFYLFDNFNAFLLLPLAILLPVPADKKRQLYLFAALLIMFSAIFFVKGFAHYYMLLLPPGFLLVGSIADCILSSENFKVKLIYYLSFGLFICQLAYNSFIAFQVNVKTWNRSAQLKTAAEINKVIPKGSEVLVLTDFYYYYLCNFVPQFPKEFGFIFIEGLIPAQKQALLDKTNTFLVKKDLKDIYLPNGNLTEIQIPNSNQLIIMKNR